MGCVTSSTPRAGAEVEATAKQQRRRLSLAPQHVGDTKGAKVQEMGKDESYDLNLSEVEKQAKGTWDHVSLTRKGLVPYNNKKVNQDRPVVKYAIADDPEVSLFGVMDGHGEYGHLVSSTVQKLLPEHLAKQTDIKTSTEQCILDATAAMCKELKETSINLAFSGTTAVYGVTIGKTIYVANIGDSRCVLCQQGGGGAKPQAVDLSEDQKPENPLEKARIIKAGGRVEKLPGPPDEDLGPMRVWLAEVDVPGLAMSRSIGDEVSQTVGVISVPEIKRHDIGDNDIFMIFASDGVWEFMSSQDAVDLVWENRNDWGKAAKELVAESVKRWKAEEEVIDDITCVIVCFNQPKE